MQKLVDGIHRFQKDVFCTQERFFQRLVDGQKPLALFITCSDSRIDPNMLTQTRPGELFIMRNAGNIVPPYGSASSGEAPQAARAAESSVSKAARSPWRSAKPARRNGNQSCRNHAGHEAAASSSAAGT